MANDCEYLAIGTQNGCLLIVADYDFRKIAYRNEVAKASISLIKELPKLGVFLCYSADQSIGIVQLKGEELCMHHEIALSRPLVQLCVFKDRFMSLSSTGECEMFFIRRQID
jgi:hypothetical protein